MYVWGGARNYQPLFRDNREYTNTHISLSHVFGKLFGRATHSIRGFYTFHKIRIDDMQK